MIAALWVLAAVFTVWFILWAVRDEQRYQEERSVPDDPEDWPFDVEREGI